MDRMYFGGFIDNDLKNQIGDNLQDINRLGGTANLNLSYWSFQDSLFKSDKAGIMLKIEQRADAHLNFTDDLFNLTFRGNKGFIDEPADLSRLYSGTYVYQKYGVGIFDKRTFSSVHLSLVNGQSFFETSIAEASLETDPDLDSISLQYLGTLSYSDSSRRSLNQSNGIGFAFDMNANILLKDNSGLIRVSLNNLGLIRWNENTQHWSADTSLVYTGVDIQDVLDDSLNNFNVPTLSDTLAFDRSKGRRNTALPGSASVTLLKKIKEKNFLEVGIKVRANRTYIPKLMLGYQYMLNENTLLGTRASYGGYGGLRIGANFERTYKGFYLKLATEDLPGLFLRDLHGKNLYFSLGKFIQQR